MTKSAPAFGFGLASLVIPLQGVLTGTAVLMGAWAGMPWLGSVGLAVLGAAAMAAATRSLGPREMVRRGVVAAAWAGTAGVLVSALLAHGARATLGTYLDGYYVAVAWMIVAAILPVCRDRPGGALKAWWRLLALFWAVLGALSWIGASYVHNRPGAFFICLVILLALLVLCHFWFRLKAVGIVAVNTLILLILGLPVVDLLVRSAAVIQGPPEARQHLYLYTTAKDSPAAFGRWWNYYVAQWRQAEKQIYAPDPDPVLTYRLRPNSRAQVAQSVFSINSRGFRGREIPAEKGDAYRIVALGESTTFGVTLDREDRPWPELLEQLIRERLNPRRPVEVINAGTPGYRLDQNLRRFPTEILPLKPDMVISYHGINAFPALRSAVPFSPGARPPAYKERPLRLLADAEYRLRLMRFRHRRAPKPLPHPATSADPLATAYADLYRQLIQITLTNHIKLALANYAMAVNDQSAPALVEFYQAGYPAAPWQIQANRIHSIIVRKLAAQHPEVCFVDTHPHLDGEHDKFIDLVHFAPAGDRQMAETFFNALRPFLETNLFRL